MRKLMQNIYWSLERIITPRLRYSQLHYYEVLKRHVPRGCAWLDMGCGHQMFADFMAREEKELAERSSHLVGIDLDFEGMLQNHTIVDRVFGDIRRLPFPDGTFDVVTANMVAEHLDDPATVLSEVHRVLRGGGRFIFHTPNRRAPIIAAARATPEPLKKKLIYMLERREEKDVFPTFYKINTSEDARRLLDGAGFRVDALHAVSTSAATGLFGPLAIPELLFIRLLESERLSGLRSNLIAIASKPAQAGLHHGS